MSTPYQPREATQLPFPDEFKPESLDSIGGSIYSYEIVAKAFGHNRYDRETRGLIALRAAELAQPSIDEIDEQIADATRRIEVVEEERRELELKKGRIETGLRSIRSVADTSYYLGFPGKLEKDEYLS